MWMMGYNEAAHHEDHMNMNLNMMECTTNAGSRKLRPLVPRPPPPTSSSYNRLHHDHLNLPINHHHHHHLVAAGYEQNKREFMNSHQQQQQQQMVVVSSRWNPTPEQLQTLEELYRRGTRTPSAEEIQHITAQLRRYGKIEGKNVFYWFQNHKARERQKRRRQLIDINPPPPPPAKDQHQQPLIHQQQPPPNFLSSTDHILNTLNLDQSTIQRKDNSEVEETRNWAIPTFSEKNVLRESTRKTTESGMMVMIQQEEKDEEEEGNDQPLLVHRRTKSFPARNATWSPMMHRLTSSSSPPTNHVTITNSSTSCSPATTTLAASKTLSSLVVSSQRHPHDGYETLQLFPVNTNARETPEKCFFQTTTDVINLNPRQFIEFLPLKK